MTIPEGCVSIGEQMFYSRKKLSTVSFPATLKNIGVQAFWDDTALNGKVFIPVNVETIGSQAFRNITGIRCAAASKPDGWAGDLKNTNISAEWGQTA